MINSLNLRKMCDILTCFGYLDLKWHIGICHSHLELVWFFQLQLQVAFQVFIFFLDVIQFFAQLTFLFLAGLNQPLQK